MSDRLTLWFPLGIMVLLALLTFWLERTVQGPLFKRDGSARHDPDYWVENFVARRLGKDGLPLHMLAAIKLKRGNNVYIANIVKCRPPGNRNPEADEIVQCLPYLQRPLSVQRHYLRHRWQFLRGRKRELPGPRIRAGLQAAPTVRKLRPGGRPVPGHHRNRRRPRLCPCLR